MLIRSIRPIGFIEPCQPTTASKPPAGPGWIHESNTTFSDDGALHPRQRAPAHPQRQRLAERYPAVTKVLEQLEVRSCLIDGEIVVCDERGLAVFELLRRGPRVQPEAHLCAFDLLELDGHQLRNRPIEARKDPLMSLLRNAGFSVQLSEETDKPGDVVFEYACKLGCEGIVSKRLGSRYRPGPTKCQTGSRSRTPRHRRCDVRLRRIGAGAPDVSREQSQE